MGRYRMALDYIRTRYLVNSRTRGAIVRSLNVAGNWQGRRKDVKMKFELLKQANLNGERIAWRARIRGIWRKGIAGTVTEAVREIEHQAGTPATAEKEACQHA